MLIRIHKLRANAVLGVYERERDAEREIIVSASVEYDSSQAAATDSIGDALDYEQIHDAIVEVIAGSQHRLIETLTAGILQRLKRDPRVLSIEVEVEKP